ncbi:MAG: TAXI family TRAP transporter solute-binding subunit [Dehalobacterium sp.]
MRKKFCLLLIGLIVMFILTGCSGSKEQQSGQEGSNEEPKIERADLIFSGANPGGGGDWDLMGAGVAEAVRRGTDGAIGITLIPGEGVSNPVTVSESKADIAFSHNVVATSAVLGIEPYDTEYSNLKAIGALYSGPAQFIVPENSKIQKIADIKENKIPIQIAVDNPGSVMELTNRRMLAEYGITYEDIESWGGKIIYKGFGEAADLMKDGKIDVFSTMAMAPSGAVQELAITNKLRMLDFGDIYQTMSEKYGYMPFSIPKDSYEFLTGDVQSFATWIILLVRDDMPEDVAYNITKSLGENLEYLKTVHSNLKPLTPEMMAANAGIDLHPGALKYYQEVGAVK